MTSCAQHQASPTPEKSSRKLRCLYPVFIFLSLVFSSLALLIAGVHYYQQYLESHLLESYVAMPKESVNQIQLLLENNQHKLFQLEEHVNAQNDRIVRVAQTTEFARANWIELLFKLNATFTLLTLEHNKDKALAFFQEDTARYKTLGNASVVGAIDHFTQTLAALPNIDSTTVAIQTQKLQEALSTLTVKVIHPPEAPLAPLPEVKQNNLDNMSSAALSGLSTLRHLVIIRTQENQNLSTEEPSQTPSPRELRLEAKMRLSHDLEIVLLFALQKDEANYQLSLDHLRSDTTTLTVKNGEQQRFLALIEALKNLKIGFLPTDLAPVQQSLWIAKQTIERQYAKAQTESATS